MRRQYRALLVSFLLPLIVSTGLSQQSGFTSEKQLKRQRQRLQAISMVEQTAAEAPLWNEKKAAVQVLADAADLLWDNTPGQSAKWLTKAWALIDQVTEPAKNERVKEFFNPSVRAQLRTAVLSVARKHDAQLADKFLKQLAESDPGERRDRGAFDERTARSEQLLRLAQQAIETNPDQAFILAQSSLSDGISQGLQNVLTTLRKKNVELANQLFDLALARFGSGTPDPSEALILAGYLFDSGITYSTNSSGTPILVLNPAQRSLPSVALAEPQRARNFLVAVYQSLLARPISVDSDEGKLRGQKLLVLGSRVLGRYNRYAPELAQPAQGFLAQLQRQLGVTNETLADGASRSATTDKDTTTKPLTKEELYEKRLTELEDAADKENNVSFKKLAYMQAALAAKPEDYLRGKRIAEKITDDDLRTDAVSFVLYRAALFFVDKEEIDKAVDIAPQISDALRRAVVKITIAQRLVTSDPEKGEPGELSLRRQRAFDLLVDIERDLKKEEPSANAAKIALGRTALLAKLDSAQALVSLEQAVQMINKLDTFDLRDRAAPDLDLGASPTSGATVARPKIGFDFRNAVEPVIKADFEQISAVVERLTLKEVNGLGRLEVAKLYLQKTNDSSSPPKELRVLSKSQ